MKTKSGGKLLVCVAITLALLAFVPACHGSPKTKAEKHALKIEKDLAKYKAGSYLHLVLNNNTEVNGTLGTLSETSFDFSNTETNAKETHLYGDVYKVEKGKQYIGEGSEKHHRIHIF